MTENIKITNAFWEERNLGISVYEAIVNEKAGDKEFRDISQIKGDLIYVKIHCENTSLIEKLSHDNFVHIENQFSIQKRLQKVIIPQIFMKSLRFIEPHIVSSLDEAQLIFDELEKDLFTLDRIALDSDFGVKVANLRYKNWISDMINSGNYECTILKTKSESIAVAFFINKYEGSIGHCVLGAVFNNFKNRGISHSFIYFSIQNSIKQSCKVLQTKVSGNNISVFNIYSSVFGFEISENHIVMVKKRLK